MQTRRQSALSELTQLAEKLRNHNMVFPHLTLKEELDIIVTWANTDGTRSGLPEIDKQIKAIELKVREQINLSLWFLPFIHLICFFLSAGSRIQAEVVGFASVGH